MDRALRRTRTETVRRRRRRQWIAAHGAFGRATCTPRREGRMRSQSALACSRPACGICHPDKRWKAKSARVRRRVEGRKAVRGARA